MTQQTVTDELDYHAMQLKVGLEVHQQLSTRAKLFCGCPCFSGTETLAASGDADSTKQIQSRYPVEFTRILRAAASELGELDPAAKFEARSAIRVRYLSNKETSCLVEADEEPPHPINQDALETSLIFALALKSRIIDEIHVMRKIVVDGSNTSGFQRTAVVSLGGFLEYGDEGRKVGVQSISLEEDASRAVKLETQNKETRDSAEPERTYILDRLGTPLVEVALAPLGGTPEEVEEAAGSLGRMLRSSGRIARGLGTIRQDLNISVMGGSVVEVKGVQKLDQLSKVVRFESARQKFFFDLASDIRETVGPELQMEILDASELFRESSSKIIQNTFSTYGVDTRVSCIVVKKFAGYIGRENLFQSRLGKELGAIARAYSIGGIFHSDELPNYGITSGEVTQLRERFHLSKEDAFILLAGAEQKTRLAGLALVERLRQSLHGIPPETRAANEDGETVFLRPRPGAARMYPETDIPLIKITKDFLERLSHLIPEPWDKQVKKFELAYKLSPQLATQLFDSDRRQVFEEVMKEITLPASFVAYSLIDVVQSLSGEGVKVDQISNKQFKQVLIALDQKKFAKEALSDLLKVLSENPELSAEEAVNKIGLSMMSKDDLRLIVKDTIAKNPNLVKTKGSASQSTLMGMIMRQVRGKIDGKIVNEILAQELNSSVNQSKDVRD
jgi:glutamyl-tRNA(Gln) amidotransferase subunit E